MLDQNMFIIDHTSLKLGSNPAQRFENSRDVSN